MSNKRIIGWLMLGIILLALANLFATRDSIIKPSIAAQPTLLSIPDESISLIEISRNGKVDCVLTKTGNWRIVEPFSGSANETAVLRLIDTLLVAKIEDGLGDDEVLKLGHSREDFMLEPPHLSVRLKSYNDETTVGFGALTPSRSGVYASVSGINVVFVVPSNTLSTIDLPISSFRQSSLFASSEDSVTSFDIKGNDELLKFRKEGDGWLMIQPSQCPASQTRVKKLLSDVFAAKAVDFIWPVGSSNEVDEASSALLAGYGLDSDNAVSMTLKNANGTERRVIFGSEAPNGLVYALVHNGTAIVTVERSLKDSASLGNAAYSDTRLFPYEISQISSITLLDDGVSCLIAKTSDGSWRMDSPVVADADPTTVNALVDSILSIRSTDIDDSGIEVGISCEKRKVKISKESLGQDFSLENLRSLDMLKIDPSSARRISVTGTDTNKTTSILFDRDRNAWNVESSPVAGTVSATTVEKILASVNPLRASRVVKLKVSADDLGKYGLDVPRLTLAIDIERDDSIRRNILVGERSEGGYYATVGASDAVFILPYQTFLDLSQEIVIE